MRIAALLFLVFIFPLYTEAQYESNSFLSPTLELALEPAYPQPGETATLTVNDYRGTNGSSEIEWYVDNRNIAEAKNQRSTQLTVGDVGTSNTVKAVITSAGGMQEVLTTTIRPVFLDIIIEPQTRVPDFYTGRALPSVGSLVNVTALLNNGSMMSPAELVYTWRINQDVVDGGPIRGRNKTSFTVPQGSEIVISLQVSRNDGTTVARRSISIPSVRPTLHFYEVSPLYGTSPKAVSKGFSLIGNSATLKAEPYYLDSRIYNNPSITDWSINGNKASSYDDNPYEITLQRTGYSGSADLGFHVRSTKLLLQGAQDSVQINF